MRVMPLPQTLQRFKIMDLPYLDKMMKQDKKKKEHLSSLRQKKKLANMFSDFNKEYK